MSYIPGQPDEGFLNGAIPDEALQNSAAVGSSNAPVDDDVADAGPVAPPRGGAGSGHDEWAAYAAELGVDVPEDATRDDIIAAVDAHTGA